MADIRSPMPEDEPDGPRDPESSEARPWPPGALDHTPELVALCEGSISELLNLAWKDRDADFSLPRDALAFRAGTFGHLSRLTRLFWVNRVGALGGGTSKLSKLAPAIRRAGYDSALNLAADVVRVAIEQLEEPEVPAFDRARLWLTATQMADLSHDAASGAVVLAFIGSACPQGADAPAAAKFQAAYVKLPPDRRAMALTATESEMTRGEQEAEDLITHKELADIFGRDKDAISKTISKDKRSIEKKLRKYLSASTQT